MDALFVFGARYLFLAAPLGALVFFLRQPRSKQKEIVIFSLISLPLIYVLALLASHLYFDARPFIVGHFTPLIPSSTDNGFPSDHMLLVSAVASIVVCFNRRVGIILWSIAVCVGLSRVYVGVHHLVDILGSAGISLGVTSFVQKIIIKHIYF
jgi:undecaprenyl-diphosphatase